MHNGFFYSWEKMFSEKHIDLREYVAAGRGELFAYPSLEDITAAVTFSFVRGLTSRTLKGRIFSPRNEPVVVFARTEYGFGSEGFLFAASSTFEIYCERVQEEFKVMFNREWLGRILPVGQILTTSDQMIGQAYHPSTDSLTIGPLRFRAGNNYFPFYINNRTIANIWVSPDFSDQHPGAEIAVNENGYGQPIVQLFEKPSAEEEKWLTVFAVLEVAFWGHSMI